MYKINRIEDILRSDRYHGRGIIVGTCAGGECAVTAYFIMGRSDNSRNRVFALDGGALFTRPFDTEKVGDPSLIIYCAMRPFGNRLIVTNGDQTDTVYDALSSDKSFSAALDTRTFEPDAPNYTPRISALLTFENGGFSYEMNIIKSIDADASGAMRSYYKFGATKGLGHFIHTYAGDGDPLPPFSSEPERIAISDDIDLFSNAIWNSLDPENKISLYVRYTDLKDLSITERLYNKNGGSGI